jgi:low temperature requirement protein LtrA
VTATRLDVIERVSTLELFFDLVIVLTITQLTGGSMWSWRPDRFSGVAGEAMQQ